MGTSRRLLKSIVSILFIIAIYAGVLLPIHAEEPPGDVIESDVLTDEYTASGLEDYTIINGWEPSDTQQHIQVNPYARSAGPLNVVYLAVFIEFPDCPDTHLDDDATVSAAELLLNQGGTVTAPGSFPLIVPSLRQYVEQYTYNKISTTSYIFPKGEDGSTISSYVAPHDRSYYLKKSPDNPDGYDESNRSAREAELVAGAVSAMKEQVAAADITGDMLDADGDGNVDAISFFVEGGLDKVDWQDLLWPHKIDAVNAYLPEGTEINGKGLSSWNLISTDTGTTPGAIFSLNRSGYGILVHEYMHILGLPDLYRAGGNGDPVGRYDIMADTDRTYPQSILAAMSSEYPGVNWHTPLAEVRSSGEYTVKKPAYADSSEPIAVKIYSPFSDSEYFVAEYFARNIWMEHMQEVSSYPDSDGLLVYRMVNDKYTNIDGGPGEDMLYIFRPGETVPGEGGGSIEQAVLNKSANRNVLGKSQADGDFDNQCIYYSDGSNSGIVIEVKEETADAVTFSVTVPTAQGTGSREDPFLISKPEDFDLIRNNPDKHFKIINDIDFGKIASFSPIPQLGSFQSGEGGLDGNQKTISNLKILNGAGLFENLDGYVKNLNFENISVTGKDGVAAHTGGVAGTVNGIMENVCLKSGTVTNTINSGNSIIAVGGLAGWLGDSAAVKNCCSFAKVEAAISGTGNINAGGLFGGIQTGKIENCFAAGTVTGKTSGGIAGLLYSMSGSGGVPYQKPVHCYFDSGKADLAAVGGLEGSMPPGMSDKSDGMCGVKAPQQIKLELTGTSRRPAALSFTPAVSDPPAVTLQVADASIATVAPGQKEVQALKAGSTTLTFQLNIGGHIMTLTSGVSVTDSSIHLKGISLNKGSIALYPEDQTTLTVSYTPQNTTDSKSIRWTSSQPSVATVNGGQITALQPGTTSIKAYGANNTQAECLVTVNRRPAVMPELEYRSYLLNKGWQDWKKGGQMSGDSSQSGRIEAIQMKLKGQNRNGDILYQSKLQDGAWQDWKKNGGTDGTTGQSKYPEAIKICLSDELEQEFDVYYRAYVQSKGWLGWARNGEPAGTTGYSQYLQGLEARLVKKGGAAPGSTVGAYLQQKQELIPLKGISLNKGSIALYPEEQTTLTVSYMPQNTTDSKSIRWTSSQPSVATVSGGQITALQPGTTSIKAYGANNTQAECLVTVNRRPAVMPELEYRSYLLNKGWQDWKKGGQMSGDSSQGSRIEAIQMKLKGQNRNGDILYQSKLQDGGWQDWKKNGETDGTAGQSKYPEAFKICLSDELEQEFDICYRVYVQSKGWLGWARNGEPAGTTGYYKYLQGLDVRLVQKGGDAPGDTDGAYLHQEPEEQMPYTDISAESWYYESVLFMYQRGIMTGTKPDKFDALGAVSRAQFATILYRITGSPEIEYSTRFPDVPDGLFYTKPVLWAAESGIVTGYESGLYGPADRITREQMAVMIYRYAKYYGFDTSKRNNLDGYSDCWKISGFALEAFQWANAEEIIKGNANGTLAPRDPANRAACATMMMRYINSH